VILLDEATSSMDVNHAVSILDLIRDAVEKDGKIVVSVFQDINLAALYCDHFVFMNNGSLMAEGRVGDIFTEETIQTVFGIQSRIGFNTFANAKQVAFKRTSCA
jgi:iron complex transport system ATP-binding protein